MECILLQRAGAEARSVMQRDLGEALSLMIGFLNTNSGAIQALSALVLVLITGAYAYFTLRLLRVSQEQLHLNAQQWLRHEWTKLRAITSFAQQVSVQMARVPTATLGTFLTSIEGALPTAGRLETFQQAVAEHGDPRLRPHASSLCATISDIRTFKATAALTGPELDQEGWRSLVKTLADECDQLANAAMITLWKLDLDVEARTGASSN